ncbi:MAG: RNA polymerase sigma factor [Chitinophagaceae bacterium]
MQKEKYQHITDSELLQNFYQDKNNEWLGILLQRYTLLLLGTCMKYLKNEEAAKDAVQQIFLKALSELNKYEVTYVKSWLYMIAKNYCLMQLRDKHKLVEVGNIEEENLLEEWNIDVLLQKEKTLTILEDCLKELQSEQKTCVTLFYLQKKSYQQIVSETNFTHLQVKSYIQNGKRNLKLLIEKKMKHS